MPASFHVVADAAGLPRDREAEGKQEAHGEAGAIAAVTIDGPAPVLVPRNGDAVLHCRSGPAATPLLLPMILPGSRTCGPARSDLVTAAIGAASNGGSDDEQER